MPLLGWQLPDILLILLCPNILVSGYEKELKGVLGIIILLKNEMYYRPVETEGTGWDAAPPPLRFLLNSIFDESKKIVLK